MRASNSSAPHHFPIFFFAILALLATIVAPTCAQNISPKSSVYITAYSGVYTVSFSSNCVLTLGYTKYYGDLGKLSTSIPSTFTVLTKSSYYSTSYGSSLSFSDTYYLALFNNDTSSCYYSSFSTSLDINTVYSYSSSSLYTIPYGVTKTFKTYSSDQYLKVQSGSSSISLAYSSESRSTEPSITPSNLYSTVSLSSYSSKYIYVYSYSYIDTYAYTYLKCQTVGGCNVYLSTQSNNGDGGSNVAMIGGITGPIVFIALFTFIVVFISTIIRRRRRMLLAAAATTAIVSTTTYPTHTTYIPTPVQNTTERTSFLAQPGVSQPYPNYQPYVNQTYTQPTVAQPYGNQTKPTVGQPQPQQPQPQPTQPSYQTYQQPQYYNPGVGVYTGNPSQPAYNPNTDRV